MKISKIIIAIFTLMLFNSTLPKVYSTNSIHKPFGNKDFPVLDACIFLDTYYFDTQTGKWSTVEEKDPVYTKMTEALTLHKELTIVSSNLMRNMIDLQSHAYELEKINKKGKWLKFATKDYEFVILIPTEKYQIKDINELEKIGINKEFLIELDSIPNSKNSKFYEESEKAQQKNFEFLLSNEMSLYTAEDKEQIKEEGLVDIDSLLKIFSETPQAKKIMKRIFLMGHGAFSVTAFKSQFPIQIQKPISFNFSEGRIAQLRPVQYIKFLKKLSEIECSFLYVVSCYYGGLSALSCQNDSFYQQEEIFEKFDSITREIPFIIAIESSPDTATTGKASNLNKLFIEITKFFEKQKKALIDYLDTNKEIKLETKVLAEAASEIDILSGKFVNKIKVNETEELKKTDEKISLIEQQPWIIKSLTEAIFESKNNEFLSLRFPGKPFFRTEIQSVYKIINDLKDLGNEFLQLKKEIEKKEKLLESVQDLQERKKYSKEKIKPLKNKIIGLEEQKIELMKAIEKTDSISIDRNLMLSLKSQSIIASRITSGITLGLKKEFRSQDIVTKTPEIYLDYNYTQYFTSHPDILMRDFIQESYKPMWGLSFETHIKNVLLYSSLINLKINISKLSNFLNFISMIPGRAQHYIDSIEIKNLDNCENIANIVKKFYAKGAFDKLFFIKNIFIKNIINANVGINSNLNPNLGTNLGQNLGSCVVIKISRDPKNFTEKSKILYLYKNKEKWYRSEIDFLFKELKKENYEIVVNEELITEDQAKKTLKNWILQTTPTKEAIYEATAGAGMENIYKFREKISNIKKENMDEKDQVKLLPDPFFKDMFNSYELGKITKKEKEELSKLTSEIIENVKKK